MTQTMERCRSLYWVHLKSVAVGSPVAASKKCLVWPKVEDRCPSEMVTTIKLENSFGEWE